MGMTLTKRTAEPQGAAKKPFSHLRSRGGNPGSNLGGNYSLPEEFDSRKYAAAFVPEGNEVEAKQHEQAIVGTEWFAPGWKVWKFPKLTKAGEDHPSAGKTYIVPATGKNGVALVLMYRSQEIQNEINKAYAGVSRDRLNQEADGETVSVGIQGDTGMLSDKRLSKVLGSERSAEEEAEEEAVRSNISVDGGNLEAGRISKKRHQLRN